MKVVVNIVPVLMGDNIKIGLVEIGKKLCLPEIDISDDLDIDEAVKKLVSRHLDCDPSFPNIIPTIFRAEKDRNPAGREIALAYLVMVGGDIDSNDLEWYDSNRLEMANDSLIKDHFEIIARSLR